MLATSSRLTCSSPKPGWTARFPAARAKRRAPGVAALARGPIAVRAGLAARSAVPLLVRVLL